jgi:hypothetical protein
VYWAVVSAAAVPAVPPISLSPAQALVELQRRAWHMRALTFMIAQRRLYSFSECETRLIALLATRHRFSKGASKRSVSRAQRIF